MTDKISCILVDDDRIDLLTTEAFLETYPFIGIIGCYTAPEAALDFLVKPLEHDRFAAMVGRLKEYITVRRKADMLSHALGADTVFIKDGTQQIKLALHDIIYLEALNNYTCVVTAGRKYTVLSTLNNLLQEKAFRSFVRIHRSYAVQRHLVRKIGSTEVIVGDVPLPVGRTYKPALDDLKRNSG